MSMSLTCYRKSAVSDVLRGCYEETAPVEFRLKRVFFVKDITGYFVARLSKQVSK